jgi:hypothetical protein
VEGRAGTAGRADGGRLRAALHALLRAGARDRPLGPARGGPRRPGRREPRDRADHGPVPGLAPGRLPLRRLDAREVLPRPGRARLRARRPACPRALDGLRPRLPPTARGGAAGLLPPRRGHRRDRLRGRRRQGGAAREGAALPLLPLGTARSSGGDPRALLRSARDVHLGDGAAALDPSAADLRHRGAARGGPRRAEHRPLVRRPVRRRGAHQGAREHRDRRQRPPGRRRGARRDLLASGRRRGPPPARRPRRGHRRGAVRHGAAGVRPDRAGRRDRPAAGAGVRHRRVRRRRAAAAGGPAASPTADHAGAGARTEPAR